MPDPERLARLETRVDSIDEKIGCIDGKLFNMDNKINDIHTTVVTNNTSMGWVRKLLMIIIGLVLAGGVTYGYKVLTNSTVVAQENPVNQETSTAANDKPKS